MLIAQISDMHVVETGKLCNGLIPSNDMLIEAIERINFHSPTIDLIIASGDLTNNGTIEEYIALSKILDSANSPVLLIPGNHDNRENLRKVFSYHNYIPNHGNISYLIENYPIKFIGIDTSIQGMPGGEVSNEQIKWLDKTLKKLVNFPVIIFMHHPPFKTGIWWMDAIGLKGVKKFENVISKYSNIKAVLAGHLHRQIQSLFAGTIGYIAPSTAHQIALDLDGKDFLGCTLDPPAFTIHYWQKNNSLVSHICYVKKMKTFLYPQYRNEKLFSEAKKYFHKSKIEMDKE